MVFYHYGSVTRIANLAAVSFEVQMLPRSAWGNGDYVVGEVLGLGAVHTLEWPTGRIGEVVTGDLVVGALGQRAATLELIGDWRSVGDDLQMHALSAAGVFGLCTSRAPGTPTPMLLRYVGHVFVLGQPVRMEDYVPETHPHLLHAPLVQIIGTSMECGKTTAAKAIIRLLRRRVARVAGLKLTGVARQRDILSMYDAGAEVTLDFVDAGLPSTLVLPATYVRHLTQLLHRVAAANVDVVVAELGASPMEPYNGEAALELLGPRARLTVLAAADLYAVLGAMEHLSVQPDLIVGRVASTVAGVKIAKGLTGVPVLNVLDPSALPALDELLWDRLT